MIPRVEYSEREPPPRFWSIVLFTVCEPSGETPDLNVLDKVMEKLGAVIKHDLRRGDVISKYSGAQFVIMLPDARYAEQSRPPESVEILPVSLNLNTYAA